MQLRKIFEKFYKIYIILDLIEIDTWILNTHRVMNQLLVGASRRCKLYILCKVRLKMYHYFYISRSESRLTRIIRASLAYSLIELT